MPLLIGTLIAFGCFIGLLLSRRYIPREPHKAALVCGSIVVASSAYALLTTSPGTLTFRVHVVLFLATVMAMLYRILRLRRS